MIKQNKDSVGVMGLELGIKILFLININKAHTAIAIIVIFSSICSCNIVYAFLKERNIKIKKSLFMVNLFNFLMIDCQSSNFFNFTVESQLLGNIKKCEFYFREPLVVGTWL